MLSWSQFHQPIFGVCKGTRIKQMEHKILLFCFTNISAESLLYILDYKFCTEHHILVHFCQLLLPLKASKISAQKLLFIGTQNVDEIDHRALFC
jgi:hypothetical protein